MSDLIGPLQSFPHQTNTIVSSTLSADTLKILPLGTMAQTRDGRKFRFASAGAADLVVGNALQSAVPIANHQAMAVQAAAAIGDTTIAVTLGATLATANQYAQGYITITATPGNGYTYRIKSHPAAAQSATLVLTLEADDPVQVALTTGSTASLTPNLYAGVIQTPVTTLTGVVVGGAVTAITATNYGWIQTFGVFNGLNVGTAAVGSAASCPTSVAGGFAINSGTLPVVGTYIQVGVDAVNKPIFLQLD